MSNKYLEKVAISLGQAKTYGKAAVSLAKANPLVAGGAALGAADGAMKTTHQNGESNIRTAVRGIRNTVMGAAGGALVGGAAQYGLQHLKAKSGL